MTNLQDIYRLNKKGDDELNAKKKYCVQVLDVVIVGLIFMIAVVSLVVTH